MNNIYFLDTSYILALEIKNEDAHQQVVKNWTALETTKPLLVTTTYVFDEVVTFLNSRNLHHKAIKVGNQLLESTGIDLVEINKKLFDQGWQYFQKHRDKSYSFTDCLSFILMQNRGITSALTLDNHFCQAGFETLPLQS
jgi:uncharacterized protein